MFSTGVDHVLSNKTSIIYEGLKMGYGEKIEGLIVSRKIEELIVFLNETVKDGKETWWENEGDLMIYTPVSFACITKRPGVVLALIENSFYDTEFTPPRVELRQYWEPVECAARIANKKLVKVLLKLGFSGLSAYKMYKATGLTDSPYFQGNQLECYKLVKANIEMSHS
jgi:hypothetical protein